MFFAYLSDISDHMLGFFILLCQIAPSCFSALPQSRFAQARPVVLAWWLLLVPLACPVDPALWQVPVTL